MTNPRFPSSIETGRLSLLPPAPEQAGLVNAAICESFVDLHQWMEWAQKQPTLEETTAHALRAAERFRAGEDFPIWGFIKHTHQFVLACGLHRADWEVPKFEIGYWCSSSHQGQGYVTEAVKALTWLGFEHFHAERMEIRCDARNLRSARVAQRAGYALEAELKHEKRAPDGQLRNTLIYVRFRADHARETPAEPAPLLTF